MMEHMHHSFGNIVYDPRRGQMRNNTENWCIIEVGREITRYYRDWLQREQHIILDQPSWDAHISVISGKPIPDATKSLWKKHQGRRVDFQYEHGNIEVSPDKDKPGSFYHIRVVCPFATALREELGLPGYKIFHLTIGRTYW